MQAKLTTRPSDGDGEHRQGLHVGGLREAQVGLVENVDRHEEQQHGVEGCGENLEACVAERAFRVGRPLAQLHGGQRDRQPGGVREHVGGVGDQRQALREDAAHDLGNEEARREDECPGQLARIGTPAVIVPMAARASLPCAWLWPSCVIVAHAFDEPSAALQPYCAGCIRRMKSRLPISRPLWRRMP